MDLERTVFASHHGLYRFVRLLFGLENAQCTLRHAMHFNLAAMKYQFALLYLDDIEIYPKFSEKHIGHVRKFLTLLDGVGDTFRLAKGKFFSETIDNLSHVQRPRRLEIALLNTDPIRGLQLPTNLTELRPFLRLSKAFSRFVLHSRV